MFVARTKALDVAEDAATTRSAPAPGRAELLPAGAHLALASDRTALARLAAGWRALEAHSASRAGVFQSYDWVSAWADTYLDTCPGLELATVAGYRGDRLVFVWPLMSRRIGPLAILRGLTEPLGQYGDILLARGECPRPWGEAALRLLEGEGRYHGIRLRHVRADSPLLPIADRYFRDARNQDRAPWMDLTAYPDDTAYEARYSAIQRRRRKKLRRHLEDAFGPLAFDYLEGADAEAAVADAIAEKIKWIDERGRHDPALGEGRLAEFLSRLIRDPAAMPRLVVSRMSAGGRPISWEIGLRYGATHYGFITSHVASLTDYSPGRLHMDYSQRGALAQGLTTFDLMVPDDPHKQSWSSASVATADYYRPFDWLGHLYGRVYLENLRPALRHFYHRAPRAPLRVLKRFIRI